MLEAFSPTEYAFIVITSIVSGLSGSVFTIGGILFYMWVSDKLKERRRKISLGQRF